MPDLKPLFVAPSPSWTGEQTIQAFAAEQGRTAQRNEDGSYSFVDGTKRYRTTIAGKGVGYVFVVVEDNE